MNKKLNYLFAVLLLSAATVTSCTNESRDTDGQTTTETLTKKNNTSSAKKLPGCGNGPGVHAVISYEIDTFNFHRPSKGCESGFSLCVQGHWEVECHDIDHNPIASIANKKADVWADVLDTQAELHFPIGLKDEAGYTKDDFDKFYVDKEHELYDGVILKPGVYDITETKDEMVVLVDILY
ncbi:MAG: hypothetical protein MUW56_06525 [Chryseobacterium sp.]|uniref:hypothetical protein n=1 Tax=Chryseobacterium sp. TaxID=1871047 RepID=UPI0025C2414E|nr:hypothetical protein [Chryseobacterium sp.]MCJ7933288.1 hypothetical protein [Chryseobacterium sp.]